MNTSIRALTLALTCAAASLFGTTAAQAQMVITTLPYIITTNGTYVLNSNLSSSQTSGNLITINASNVTIDFQGHYITGPSTGGGFINGIYSDERSNITIKNGTVAYCGYGIELHGNGTATTNSVNHQITTMRVTYCAAIGIYIASGPGSLISNCQVSQTGFSGQGSAYGILVQGDGTTVQSNIISTVTATTSYGIYLSGADFASQNKVSNCGTGIAFGEYQDNLTQGCTTPFTGGTDAGGNH